MHVLRRCQQALQVIITELAQQIVAEVIGTTLMKYSEVFTRLWPSVATIVC